MSILLKCPRGHRREVGVEWAGSKVSCQECGHIWAIPAIPGACSNSLMTSGFRPPAVAPEPAAAVAAPPVAPAPPRPTRPPRPASAPPGFLDWLGNSARAIMTICAAALLALAVVLALTMRLDDLRGTARAKAAKLEAVASGGPSEAERLERARAALLATTRELEGQAARQRIAEAEERQAVAEKELAAERERLRAEAERPKVVVSRPRAAPRAPSIPTAAAARVEPDPPQELVPRAVTTCAVCKGTGDVDCKRCAACARCESTGRVKCSSCKGDPVRVCEDCGGKGSWTKKEKRTTIQTQGPALVEYVNVIVKCDGCGGAKTRKCTTCSGSGARLCGACAGKSAVECGACAGARRISCLTCAGQGHVDAAPK